MGPDQPQLPLLHGDCRPHISQARGLGGSIAGPSQRDGVGETSDKARTSDKGSWSSWHCLTPGRYHRAPGKEGGLRWWDRRTLNRTQRNRTRWTGAMAGTGYSGSLMYFDSFEPYMAIVDGTMRKKKKHGQLHSSHRHVERDESEAT